MASIPDHLPAVSVLLTTVAIPRLLPLLAGLLTTLGVLALALASTVSSCPQRRAHVRALIADLTAFNAVLQGPGRQAAAARRARPRR